MMKTYKIWFNNSHIYLSVEDRVFKNPLSWFPRLKNATKQQLENFTLSPFGIHWNDLDEDLSFEGIINSHNV